MDSHKGSFKTLSFVHTVFLLTL